MSIYKKFFNHLNEVSPEQAEKAIKAGEKVIHRRVFDNPKVNKKDIKAGWKVYDAIVGLEDRMKEPKRNLPEIAEEVSALLEKNIPTSPDKWAQAKAAARAKFKVYPSAYANLWAAKKYKSMGGGWKKGKK